MTDSQYACNDLLISDIRTQGLTEARDRILVQNHGKGLSLFSGYQILLNCAIGSDPLWLAYCYQCGIAKTTVISFLLFLLMTISLYILSINWGFGNQFTYPNIWENAISKSTRWIPSVLQLIVFLALFVSYSWDVSDALLDILTYAFPNAPDWVLNDWFTSYVSYAFEYLLALLINHFSTYLYISYIANISMVAFGAVVIIIFIQQTNKVGFDPKHKRVYWITGLDTVTFCMDTFIQIYFIHTYVPYILRELKVPTINNVMKISWAASATSFLLNVVIGLPGYFIHFEYEDDDIIFNQVDGYAKLVFLGQIANYLCCFTSQAIYFYFISAEFHDIIFPNFTPSNVSNKLTMFSMIFMAGLKNFLPDETADIFSVLIHFCLIFLSFLFPAYLYFTNFKLTKKLQAVFVIFICIVGIVVEVLILYTSIRDLAYPEEEEE